MLIDELSFFVGLAAAAVTASGISFGSFNAEIIYVAAAVVVVDIPVVVVAAVVETVAAVRRGA